MALLYDWRVPQSVGQSCGQRCFVSGVHTGVPLLEFLAEGAVEGPGLQHEVRPLL